MSLHQHPGHVPASQIVWEGSWISDDGLYEYRACVAKRADSFLPGYECSMAGGDSYPSFGDAVATFEDAQQAAYEMMSDERQH